MTGKHLFKLSITILAVFAGIHLGVDLGAKLDTSVGSTSTPATS